MSQKQLFDWQVISEQSNELWAENWANNRMIIIKKKTILQFVKDMQVKMKFS